MARLKLPIGIQTFSKLREGGCYYVDKTPLMLKLVEEGTHYFLSRPRRFGKSLLLDTLAELFEGNEPLFRGLHAHDRWDWSRRAPVIRLSFAEGVLHSAEALDQRIHGMLREQMQRLEITTEDDSIVGRFIELIRQAHALTGERVVVLVDEYDKPILDNLTRPEIAREMRDGLRNLYSVIKGQDAHIRFAFLTGVSKFSKVSIFSGLNNLSDITIDPGYSALCGYTQRDLETVFAPELDGLDLDEIRRWYNGYNWTGESVYNPFDVLLLFQKRQFRPWWFETGTPSFLIDVLTRRHQYVPRLGQQIVLESLLSRFDVDDMPSEALLFQSGYLTIDRAEWTGERYLYHLRYPNLEVRMGLTEQLLYALTASGEATGEHLYRLRQCLAANDFPSLAGRIESLFAGIPSDWYRNNPIAQYEGYYASVFYAAFAALALDVRPEDASNQGRLDMALRFNGQVYLFEFKVVEREPEGRALQQIKDRGYADKYRADAQPIHLIGVEFSRERRAVVGFEVETLTAGAID
ncbi:ATP-binding protein [Thiocystis violacea]|uniref:ATP-binding protein n=1 Tax=Thiocystis violacea TaxID=13725 RepID=UPI001903F969|nr:ATP-binding protein [Thiocystis violacea]MBK1725271.1 hypothetical protein [Thiocystis violacea]